MVFAPKGMCQLHGKPNESTIGCIDCEEEQINKKDKKDLKDIAQLFYAAHKLSLDGPWYKRLWRQWKLSFRRRKIKKLIAKNKD